jgi:hypothetical protein
LIVYNNAIESNNLDDHNNPDDPNNSNNPRNPNNSYNPNSSDSPYNSNDPTTLMTLKGADESNDERSGSELTPDEFVTRFIILAVNQLARAGAGWESGWRGLERAVSQNESSWSGQSD